jgi:hypothetical protein
VPAAGGHQVTRTKIASTIALAAAAALAAGCSSSHSSTPTEQSDTSTACPGINCQSAAPSPSPSSQAARTEGNIILAPSTDPPGPFKIEGLYCGQFTAARRAQFGTEAAGGLIFRYTNVSNDVTGEPSLNVNFVSGQDVTGSNTTGSMPQISPGQNATGEVDALNGGGQDVTFSSCEITGYNIITSQGGQVGSYAP